MYNELTYQLGSKKSYIRELFEYGLQQAKIVGKENVFDYSLGNPSIPAPVLNDAIKKVLEEEDFISIHGYTSAQGCDAVREAVAADMTERFGMTVRPQNLFFTCGAAPALIAVLSALHASEESEIIGIAPYFVEYVPFVEATGNHFVHVDADKDSFQINFEALEAAISPNTQALIVNSPNNPSGVVYSRETLEKLAAILTDKEKEFGHPIYIVADEPYRELVYGDVEVPFIPTIYDNTIVCYSWSKSLSIPGERLGYVFISDKVTDSAELFASVAGAARVTGHVCPPSLMQKAVALCCTAKPDLVAYDENRTLLYNALISYGYECAKPQGAFYLFVKAPGGDDIAFAEAAKKHNLLVVPSTPFGVKGYFRLSYCVSNEMIQRSLSAFEAVIKEF